MTVEREKFMREAIRLARESVETGGGPFGAVIVRDGAIIGRGQNRVVPDKDPTAHAEMLAIRQACRALDTYDLSDCEIYASCEPCPMCLSAIYWARLDRLYYANTRRDAARIGFELSWERRNFQEKEIRQSAQVLLFPQRWLQTRLRQI